MIKVRMKVYEYYVNQSDGIHIINILKRLTKKEFTAIYGRPYLGFEVKNKEFSIETEKAQELIKNGTFIEIEKEAEEE